MFQIKCAFFQDKRSIFNVWWNSFTDFRSLHAVNKLIRKNIDVRHKFKPLRIGFIYCIDGIGAFLIEWVSVYKCIITLRIWRVLNIVFGSYFDKIFTLRDCYGLHVTLSLILISNSMMTLRWFFDVSDFIWLNLVESILHFACDWFLHKIKRTWNRVNLYPLNEYVTR